MTPARGIAPSQRISLLLALLALLVGLSTATAAEAHATGLSRGEYVVTRTMVTAHLVFARGELLTIAVGLDANGDKVIDQTELDGSAALLSTIPARIGVTSGGVRCAPAFSGARLEEEDGVSIDAVYECPSVVTTLSLELSLLDDLSQGHRHIGVISGLGAPRDFLAYAKQPGVTVEATGAGAAAGEKRHESFGGFFRLGIEHILTGYDHLLFLFALLLVGGRLRALLAVVTAFTIAHSVTLGLAALDIVALSPRIVEPAIALSIAYVGVENFFVKNADRRYLLTFPFGLIHGFGFAGALSEVALPRAEVPVALLAFNLGVEAGQLAVVAVALPIILWLRRQPWFLPRGVQLLSGLVVAAGLFWFVQRVVS